MKAYRIEIIATTPMIGHRMIAVESHPVVFAPNHARNAAGRSAAPIISVINLSIII